MTHAADSRARLNAERRRESVCAGLILATGTGMRFGDAPEQLRPARSAAAVERAGYDGRPGHPAVRGPEHVRAPTSSTGDRGACGLLADARTIETGHLCSGGDVDTPEDLEEVRNETRAVV